MQLHALELFRTRKSCRLDGIVIRFPFHLRFGLSSSSWTLPLLHPDPATGDGRASQTSHRQVIAVTVPSIDPSIKALFRWTSSHRLACCPISDQSSAVNIFTSRFVAIGRCGHCCSSDELAIGSHPSRVLSTFRDYG